MKSSANEASRQPVPDLPPVAGIEPAVWRRQSAFRRAVYRALCQVPRGRVTTYGDLARACGVPAARAVGQALRHNPFAPLVPCHRVVAADRSLGGFNGAMAGPELERKRRLLEEEGVALDASGRVAEAARLGIVPPLGPMT